MDFSNYSEFNPKYKSVNTPHKSKFTKQNNDDFVVRQEQNFNSNTIINKEIGTKGLLCEENAHPVTNMFFSQENIQRIQKLIKKSIQEKTNGEYRLDVDQDETGLLIAMRAVFFSDSGAKFLPCKIVHQVKQLNIQVINYILPDMISEMKQEYSYLQEINKPLEPIMRPMNVGNAGRRSLGSVMTQLNGF